MSSNPNVILNEAKDPRRRKLLSERKMDWRPVASGSVTIMTFIKHFGIHRHRLWPEIRLWLGRSFNPTPSP